MRRYTSIFVLFIFLFKGVSGFAAFSNPSPDSSSIVFVEGLDSAGQRVTLGAGVILKQGYVAVNYHFVAGMDQVIVYKQGEEKKYFSDGYLDVAEEMDVIVISVPLLKGTVAEVYDKDSIPRGSRVNLVPNLESRNMFFTQAIVKGKKEVASVSLTEYSEPTGEECTGGPIFYENKFAGFITAGYLDGRWFAYGIPSTVLLPLLKRSFIIKDYTFLTSGTKKGSSPFQDQLMESLNSVIWLSFENAIRMGGKKQKKIVIDVYTNWCGWCKLMEKNSFSRKSIISYVNENFYAVKLNAESTDSIWYQGRLFEWQAENRAHELAWSLLKGNMSYPALVFIDENGRVLTVVSGYVDPMRLEAALHFFKENAYLKPGVTFAQYEQNFIMQKARENSGGQDD